MITIKACIFRFPSVQSHHFMQHTCNGFVVIDTLTYHNKFKIIILAISILHGITACTACCNSVSWVSQQYPLCMITWINLGMCFSDLCVISVCDIRVWTFTQHYLNWDNLEFLWINACLCKLLFPCSQVPKDFLGCDSCSSSWFFWFTESLLTFSTWEYSGD